MPPLLTHSVAYLAPLLDSSTIWPAWRIDGVNIYEDGELKIFGCASTFYVITMQNRASKLVWKALKV